MRRAACRAGFGTRALAVQLNHWLLGGPIKVAAFAASIDVAKGLGTVFLALDAKRQSAHSRKERQTQNHRS
jgi:hypothetical protein